MVKPYLKFSASLNRKILTGALTAVILWHSTTITNAAMAVFDSSNFAEAIKQLNVLKEQIEAINQVSDTVDETLKTIGSYGQITLPTTNMRNIANRLRRDAQCLTPDLEQLMPSVTFEDVSFSICDGKNNYQKTLLINPADYKKLAPKEQIRLADVINKRRQNVLFDATTKGLAAADIAQQNAEDLNKLADEVENNGSTANDERTQLAAIAQGEAANIRATAQTNQLLASILRVQSAFAIEAGVNITSELLEENSPEEEGR